MLKVIPALKILIFIILATCGSLVLSGYNYGIGDQIIHIPYLKKLLNPELYQNDTLLFFMSGKPTIFWDVIFPLIRTLGIEYGLFFLQVVSLFIFFAGIYAFTKVCTKDTLASYIAVLLSIIPKYSFGYSTLFVHDNFIPRNLTVGLILFAGALFISRYRFMAYLLLGLLSSLHILSVIPILLTCLACDLFQILRRFKFGLETKQLIIKLTFSVVVLFSCLLLILTKLPSFSEKNSTVITTSADYVTYYLSILQPFYAPQSSQGGLLFISALSIVLLGLIWLHYQRDITGNRRTFMMVLLLVGLVLVIISILAEQVIMYPFLVQLQLGRSAVYSVLVFTVLVAHALSKLNKTLGPSGRVVVVLSVLIIFVMPIMFPLVLVAFVNGIAKKNKYLSVVVMVALFYLVYSINIYVLGAIEVKARPINVFVVESDNVLAQTWLRNNTPIDAIVLSPFYIGGYTEPDFRTISERTNVLTNGDIVETILNVNMIPITAKKTDDLTSGNYSQIISQRKYFDYYALKDLYHNAVMHDHERILNEYMVDYVVFEDEYILSEYPEVYSNSTYRVYKVN